MSDFGNIDDYVEEEAFDDYLIYEEDGQEEEEGDLYGLGEESFEEEEEDYEEEEEGDLYGIEEDAPSDQEDVSSGQSADGSEDAHQSQGYPSESEIHGYADRLQREVLPAIESKLQANEAVRASVIALAQGYCDKAGFSSDIAGCLETIPAFMDRGSLSDREIKALSLYVLSAVYHLAVSGGITNEEISIRNHAELGFRGSMDSFKDACQACLNEEKSVEDLSAEVSQRLGVSTGSCTMDEYFKNHVYVRDLNTIRESVVESGSEESEARKRFFDYFSNSIRLFPIYCYE